MFKENHLGELVYMTSSVIKVPHAFSTRYGGVSQGIYESLNFSSNIGDEQSNVEENYRRFTQIFGVTENDCVTTKQVHGVEVRVSNYGDKHTLGQPTPYQADGLVTDRKTLPLLCFTADCVPALLCDDKNKVIAAVHCGWRSSVGDILKVTVEKMEALGAKRENICCAMGAAIGFCCFETHIDVPDAIRAYIGEEAAEKYIFKKAGTEDKYMVDLRGANKERLIQLGLNEENIDISDECTCCEHEKYWSHRYTKGKRGSMCSGIMI